MVILMLWIKREQALNKREIRFLLTRLVRKEVIVCAKHLSLSLSLSLSFWKLTLFCSLSFSQPQEEEATVRRSVSRTSGSATGSTAEERTAHSRLDKLEEEELRRANNA
jgi:hypothetical protein